MIDIKHESKTNASRHTPGPWKTQGCRDEGEQEAIVQQSTGAEICVMANVLGQAEADIANARLIAAAPKLLAALKAFSALEVRGHPLLARLQFSEEGRKLAAHVSEALAEATDDSLGGAE